MKIVLLYLKSIKTKKSAKLDFSANSDILISTYFMEGYMTQKQVINKMKKIGLTKEDILNNGLNVKRLVKDYPIVAKQFKQYVRNNEEALKKLASY